MDRFRDRLVAVRRVLGKEEVRSLARRYFIANGFDGTLTTIGIVVGAVLSGITDGGAVIAIGLGAAVGLGTSGVWSVWEIERAEASRERERLEADMLTDLGDTRIVRDLRTSQLILATASATGPVLAVLLMLVPFLLVETAYDTATGALLSIGIGILLLASVGAYMGSISRQRWYVAAVRMALAGVVVTVISVVLPG